jgi:hypothetical protein
VVAATAVSFIARMIRPNIRVYFYLHQVFGTNHAADWSGTK